MYSGPKLLELLNKQSRDRSHLETFKGLWRQGTFTFDWRAKVGSYPHPDRETLISAGEPCGTWPQSNGERAEDKRTLEQNWHAGYRQLPLNGYIPGSSIRGVVRAWTAKHEKLKSRVKELLGSFEDDSTCPGKIVFLDAWPIEPTRLSLDIVHPQQRFQVFHEGQGELSSCYSLGDGFSEIIVEIAIRGLPGLATERDVTEVWDWLEYSLTEYGLGSRTASGYGQMKGSDSAKSNSELCLPKSQLDSKAIEFTLFSQGCYGPHTDKLELRPSHWRGWLRSWTTRFLLGVMSPENTMSTVAQLLGVLEPKTKKGCVRIKMLKGDTWHRQSANRPSFSQWKGTLMVSAPSEYSTIVLPIIEFASMLGGLGRGWRRPLHKFERDGKIYPRGSILNLEQESKKNLVQGKPKIVPYGVPLKLSLWNKIYIEWKKNVKAAWPNRFREGINDGLHAEIFSPKTCSVYLVQGAPFDPIDSLSLEWNTDRTSETRGSGTKLIYQLEYKHNPNVGGDAARSDASFCSWVSIKHLPTKLHRRGPDCKELVCLFLGNKNSDRLQFLQDLSHCPEAEFLFGVQATEEGSIPCL